MDPRVFRVENHGSSRFSGRKTWIRTFVRVEKHRAIFDAILDEILDAILDGATNLGAPVLSSPLVHHCSGQIIPGPPGSNEITSVQLEITKRNYRGQMPSQGN